MGDFEGDHPGWWTDRTDDKKTNYGISKDEPWNCVSGFSLDEFPDGWTDLKVPVYACDRCNFHICDKCYERAYYDRLYTQQLAKAIEESAAVRWNQGKIKWLF